MRVFVLCPCMVSCKSPAPLVLAALGWSRRKSRQMTKDPRRGPRGRRCPRTPAWGSRRTASLPSSSRSQAPATSMSPSLASARSTRCSRSVASGWPSRSRPSTRMSLARQAASRRPRSTWSVSPAPSPQRLRTLAFSNARWRKTFLCPNSVGSARPASPTGSWLRWACRCPRPADGRISRTNAVWASRAPPLRRSKLSLGLILGVLCRHTCDASLPVFVCDRCVCRLLYTIAATTCIGNLSSPSLTLRRPGYSCLVQYQHGLTARYNLLWPVLPWLINV